MDYATRYFAVLLTVLLSTVCAPASQLATPRGKTPGLAQQMQQQLQQMQTQQLQLQTRMGDLQKQLEQKPASDKPTSIEKYLPVLVSSIAASLSFIFFNKNRELNKQIADRTVTVEAQKLLVEINKQYITCPNLFAIYDDYPKREELLRDAELSEKVKALGFLKLNVFELVYAVLPQGGAWQAFFEDSLAHCSVLRDELGKHSRIYDKNLVRAYENWLEKQRGARNPGSGPPMPRS
jgi:hypothetical protein